MTSTAEQLRRMRDEQEIITALHRYMRGIDRLDRDLILSAFHDDAVDHHGSFDGPAVPDYTDWILGVLPMYSTTNHYVQNISFDFTDDDTAFVETYLTAVQRRPSAEVTLMDTLGGRYVDRFERRGGDWKIAERTVVHDWDDAPVSLPVSRWADLFEPYHRDKRDATYAR